MRNIILFSGLLLCEMSVIAQTRAPMHFEDSVRVRQLPNPVPGVTPTPTLQITQSGRYTAPDAGPNTDRPHFSCGLSYRNNTGAVAVVTLMAPAKAGRDDRYAVVYTKSNPRAAWTVSAYEVNSATANAYVPNGYYYCVLGGGSPGQYFLTIYSAGVPENLYHSPYVMWQDFGCINQMVVERVYFGHGSTPPGNQYVMNPQTGRDVYVDSTVCSTPYTPPVWTPPEDVGGGG